MRMQDCEANCGPYALKNALAALGIERTAGEMEAACKTSATKGTPLRNIFRAAEQIEGCTPMRIREKRRDVAMLKLRSALLDGHAVVISWCTNEPGDHWVAAVGLLGGRYLIADAADLELILSRSAAEVAEKWFAGSYEGVIL